MNFEKMLDDMTTGFEPVDNAKSIDLSSDAIEKKMSELIDKKLDEMLSNKMNTGLKESEPTTKSSNATDATDATDATGETNNNTNMKEEVN